MINLKLGPLDIRMDALEFLMFGVTGVGIFGAVVMIVGLFIRVVA